MAVSSRLGAMDLEDSFLSPVFALRINGDYEAALETCRLLVDELKRGPLAKEYQIRLGELQISYLEDVLSRPEEERRRILDCDKEFARAGNSNVAREAAEILLRTLNNQRELLGERHLETSGTLFLLALALEQVPLMANDEIVGFYRKAMEIRKDAIGVPDKELSALMNDCAVFLEEVEGDYIIAEYYYRQALGIDRQILDSLDIELSNDCNNLGQFLQNMGYFEEADALLLEALRIRCNTRPPLDYYVLQSLNNLAALHMDMERFREAESLFVEVQRRYAIDESPENAPIAFRAASNLGIVFYRMRDFARALDTHKKVLSDRIAFYGRQSHELARAYSAVADDQLALGDLSSSLANYRHALRLDSLYYPGNHPEVLQDLKNIGRALVRQDRLDEAKAALERSIAIYERSRVRVAPTLQSRAVFTDVFSPYPYLAVVHIRKEEANEAWNAVEKEQGRILLDVLAARKYRRWSVSEIEEYNELSRECDLLAYDMSGFPGESARRNKLERDYHTRKAELIELESTLQKKYPLAEGRSYDLRRIQSALDDKTAIIGWLDIDTDNFVYLVSRTGDVIWERCGPPPTPNEARNFVRIIEDSRIKKSPYARICRALYAARIAPLESRLSEFKRLCVVPSGAMAGIPMESLMPNEDGCIADRWQVSYAPSASVYAMLAEQSRHVSKSAILAVADPPFSIGQAREMDRESRFSFVADLGHKLSDLWPSRNRGAVRRVGVLPRLYGTRAEARSIAKHFMERTLLLGKEANETRLQELARSGRLGSYRVIHFATHSYADSAQAERSAIILSQVEARTKNPIPSNASPESDGMLTLAEIARDWRLDADLVTLSACNTGLGFRNISDGYIGLSYAFFVAGARSVVVSLWPVDDTATRSFMKRFYANYTRGKMTKSEALQEAKRWMKSSRSLTGKRFDSPFYWAGFILVGEPN